MFKRILPKEFSFFDLFEKHITLTKKASEEFLSLASDMSDIECRVQSLKKLEHEADDVTHQCIENLQKTFITPFDRTEIHLLIKRLDDIIDSIDGAVSRIHLYSIEEIRPEAKELAKVLVAATAEIELALKGLRNMKHAQQIKDKCIAVHGYENQGDAILRSALLRLFKEDQPMLVIKWKEIYERLEKAIDRCEDVADVIEGVIISST
jgi:uncharacterized protein Yka (UPF0111/DUF47 family)